MTPTAATELVDRYIHTGNLLLVSIGQRKRELATAAYASYGKGRHPAGLNMGDRVSYACAKANGAALLYKGQDFALTDVA